MVPCVMLGMLRVMQGMLGVTQGMQGVLEELGEGAGDPAGDAARRWEQS